jgi:hypothetical protein
MYTLRCTRKLLRRIDEAPSSEAVTPTTVLGDWYANLLYLRPQQLVLAMNERTLMCALVPAAPAATVAERLRLEVGGLLRDIGVPEAMVEAELAAMEHFGVGATASRAVPGCRHSYKYPLYYGMAGKRIVGYDNERGKGDHRHRQGHQEPYRFTTVERLIGDFLADIAKERVR